MDSIRAKFKCVSVCDFGNSKMAKLSAIYSIKGENADFTKYTPSGEISIQIDGSSPAAEFLKPQKTYYIDFSVAPAE